MRIGIECSTLTRSRAGIGFYTYHLACALGALEGDEEYSLLYNRPLPEMNFPVRLRHVLNGPSNTHLWAQTRLSSICRRECIDLLHSPGQGIPLLYDGACVFTVHDLSPMLYPEQKELTSRIIWNSLVPIMARKADHIITVSNNTKRDVMNLLGLPDCKITTVYEAAGPDYFPETDEEKIQRFRQENNLQQDFMIAVATLEPRKNLPFLFRVFARWLEQSKEDALLVIVGKKGWLYDEIFEAHATSGLGDRVRFVGYVEGMEAMRLYYAAAQFFILAPIYEGFWLPGLESLACGTPVIAPKRSSIPEVVADAGLLLDDFDEENWVAAINRMWKASDRADWSRKGIERAQQFSWEKAARETLEVYRRFS